MKSIFKLEDILTNLAKDDNFVDFLNTKSLEAGIMRLRGCQKDTQTTHQLDELYYVINGEGYIRIEGNSQPINRGTLVFISAGIEHSFYGNKADLVILYIFSKRK